MFRRAGLVAVFLPIILSFSVAALAQERTKVFEFNFPELPKEKPGLWQTVISTEGPSADVRNIQVCIGDAANGETKQPPQGVDVVKACKHDLKREGNTITVESICDFNGYAAKMHTMVIGDFTSAYTKKYTIEYGRPSRLGDVRSTIEAKYLGACKPDQKPGDLIWSDGWKVNVPDAINRGGVGLLNR